MSKYFKTIEVYKLGEGEYPEWLKKAIKQNRIEFERKDMIDSDTLTVHKNAIVGIRRKECCGIGEVYDVDSYIVYDSFKNSIKVLDSYDFRLEGFQKVEKSL